MNFCIKVQHTHSEPEIQRNVDCDFISELHSELGGCFKCPICKTEIVITIQEGAE